MNRYLEKIAVHIHLYQDPKTKKQKWVAEGKPAPLGHVKVKSIYKRRKNGTKV